MAGTLGHPGKPTAGTIRLRARVWVEHNASAGTLMTEAGADLLEQIDVCGSLSEAARRLRFAYRRAWMLVDTMNRAWGEKLVHTAAGGKRGGGTQLTEHGRAVVAAYRAVQVHVEHAMNEAKAEFDAAIHP